MAIPMTVTSDEAELFYLPQQQEINLFEQAFYNKLPVMIKGPTGCGKTRFIQYMADKLQLPLYTVACHDDLTAADLIGRYLIGHGESIWKDGPLTQAVKNGGICYLDEVVEARKDTTVVIHPLTDDRRILPIDRTGEQLKAADNFMLVISYNPGYQHLMKGLKPSTRQRFLAMEFDYLPAEKEQQVLIAETGVSAIMAKCLVSVAQALRRLKDHDLEEGASTRLLVYTATLIKSGVNPVQACEACLVQALSDEPETTNALMEIIRASFGE